MQLTLRDNLPWITLTISYLGNEIQIADVLIDTGSATTLLASDAAAQIGIHPVPEDKIFVIRGVGGQEVVFSRQVDTISIDGRKLTGFEVEIGGIDYGFAMNGILGMDFLLATGAKIDLANLEIRFE